MGRYRVICYGLGPVGCSIAKLALSRREQIEVVGAVDINPDLIGKDLGEVIGFDKKIGISIEKSRPEIYYDADIVLHATGSFLSDVKPQLIDLCKTGVDVISTNEELSFPWFHHKEVARDLDRIAKENKATLLGTGVNPGLVLDALVITLSGACANVSKIFAERILDATMRRLTFQKKVGIGLGPEEFESNVKSGKFGHVGLPESMALICSALGRDAEKIEQRISPRIAEKDTPTEYFGGVPKGKVLGLIQDGVAFQGGRSVVSCHLEMYSGAENPHDLIEITGEPNISLRIPNGTPGDIATSAMVVNSISRVVEGAPGLMTVKDLRPAHSVLTQ